MAATAEQILRDILDMQDQLRPYVKEYLFLERMLVEFEHEIKVRGPLPQTKAKPIGPIAKSVVKRRAKKRKPRAQRMATWQEVLSWAKIRTPDATYRPIDLAMEFGMSPSWCRYMAKRLVDEGVFERWGKSMYRRPPIRTGAARLKVLTR